jgi:hypothetical protein
MPSGHGLFAANGIPAILEHLVLAENGGDAFGEKIIRIIDVAELNLWWRITRMPKTASFPCGM